MLDNLEKKVHAALKRYHGNAFDESPLHNLTVYQVASSKGAPTPRQVNNEVLEQGMQYLTKSRPDDVTLLKKRFMDGKSAREVANEANIAESTVYTQQREAIEHLTDAMRELEISARSDQRMVLLRRLAPESNVNLVGIDGPMGALLELITPSKQPWLISIEGLGGIGKTTLADAIVRHAIDTNLYHEVGWISAKQNRLTLGGTVTVAEVPAITSHQLIERLFAQLFPKLFPSASNNPEQMLQTLRRHLQEVPHLIVIDNLETVADLDSLLPTLQEIANPTKFLLTSRERTFGEPNISHFVVPELNHADSLTLIRNEADISNLPELAAAKAEVLTPIHDTVGGNPLALRLVVGQTHVYTLTSILDDLKEARGQTVENLYTYIYWKAWEGLDEVSRSVFLATVFLNDEMGDDVEFLAEVSDIDLEQVRNALNVLVTRNLVDVRGDFSLRLYRIHGLTRTFLHKQVIKWDDRTGNKTLSLDSQYGTVV